jgi:hypothetical protein
MDVDKILRGKRILIVDDEEDILDFLTELLEMCKIDRASSFEEARNCSNPIITMRRCSISWGSGDMNCWKSRIKRKFRP